MAFFPVRFWMFGSLFLFHFRLLGRWFWNRRKELNVPMAFFLDPFKNLEWICFFSLHNHLMCLTIRLNILDS
ncbi:hypothetical protein Hanom_Chr09g00832991 [Helianthus anomalus]